MLLASVTSQMSVWSRISLSWIGGAPWRMALVTSSLTTSSVVYSAWASPHVRSWSVASVRAGDHGRVGGDVPGGDAVGGERAGSDDHQGGVVGRAVGAQGVDHGVPGCFQ